MHQKLRTGILGTCALAALVTATPAAATAIFSSGMGAEIEILTRTPDLLVVDGTSGFEHEAGEGSSGFSPDGLIQSLAIAQTLVLEATSQGSASWSGSGDPARSSGVARAAGTLQLLNNSPDPLDVDVLIRIPGEERLIGGGLDPNAFSVSGSVDSDPSEVAQSVHAVSLIGSRLPGIPDDLLSDFIFFGRTGTRDPLVGTNYDLLGLPFNRTFTVTLPGAVGTTFEFFNLGLRVEAGGSALSAFDGTASEPIVAEPFPFELGSRELPVPAPPTVLCLLCGFVGLSFFRWRREGLV